jgi:hypothetical protein
MNLQSKLKINWWLWILLSVPWCIYNWLELKEGKGAVLSDWSYLTSYLKQTNYTVTHDIWNFFSESFIWNCLPPLIFGWVAQYI